MMYWEHIVNPRELSREKRVYILDHAALNDTENKIFTALCNGDEVEIKNIVTENEMDDLERLHTMREIGFKIISTLKL